MPLIIITGYPCSGKTTRALEVKKLLEAKAKATTAEPIKIEIINDESLHIPKSAYKGTFFLGNTSSK